MSTNLTINITTFRLDMKNLAVPVVFKHCVAGRCQVSAQNVVTVNVQSDTVTQIIKMPSSPVAARLNKYVTNCHNNITFKYDGKKIF